MCCVDRLSVICCVDLIQNSCMYYVNMTEKPGVCDIFIHRILNSCVCCVVVNLFIHSLPLGCECCRQPACVQRVG